MARPRKMRRVCCLPEKSLFGPLNMTNSIAEVSMTVEEYEIIRLIDLEGLNQEESSEIMNVARSTIQRLYDDARKKLADALVNGKQLRIEGGDYEVCEELDKFCLNSGCYRRRHGRHNHI